jgi:hypothetical protein
MNNYSWYISSKDGDYVKIRISANYKTYSPDDDYFYGTFYVTANYEKTEY